MGDTLTGTDLVQIAHLTVRAGGAAILTPDLALRELTGWGTPPRTTLADLSPADWSPADYAKLERNGRLFKTEKAGYHHEYEVRDYT